MLLKMRFFFPGGRQSLCWVYFRVARYPITKCAVVALGATFQQTPL